MEASAIAFANASGSACVELFGSLENMGLELITAILLRTHRTLRSGGVSGFGFPPELEQAFQPFVGERPERVATTIRVSPRTHPEWTRLA